VGFGYVALAAFGGWVCCAWRGFGSLGAGVVAPGAVLRDLGIGSVALGRVWELWELESLCLPRFGS